MDEVTYFYIHHFATFCCRFLACNNDDWNPFQELVPLVVNSSTLLHSIAAVGAAHSAKNNEQHQLNAQKYYATALQELNISLSDPNFARSDSALGACLMLCVYEVKSIKCWF
jgi:hypothetical protein